MTLIQQVRLLCDDQTSVIFTDAEVQTFLDLNSFYAGNDQVFMAAALACDQRAIGAASTSGLKIGDFSTNKGIVTDFQQAADKYRDFIMNQPAFAVAEENLSGFSELEIIRNFVLRTGEF